MTLEQIQERFKQTQEMMMLPRCRMRTWRLADKSAMLLCVIMWHVKNS